MNGHGSLNRIFRVVWNVVLREWQVASEHTRGKGKTKSTQSGPRGLARLAAGSILVLCHAGALAELPTGGQITAGSGQIGTPSNGHLVINQDSNKMAIDWQSFSVGNGNTVQFIQPSAEAIALNRVLGGDPSIIRGTISANGRVVLLNPNGILFGPTSKVEVASLLASTLNMSNEDFMAGNYRLEGDSANAVINQGSIKAADGGFVALVAAKIENVGDIRVRGGDVLMGFGRKVRLDLGGPAKIEVEEAAINAYIRNGGLIKVDGGNVVMTVKTAGDLATLAINNDGIIEATSLANGDGGTIRLLAEGSTVTNSGTLNVSANNGKGGHIEVTGARVGILDGSVVDASGTAGGGTILLGGDYQGKNAAVTNAQMTFVSEGATVRANATQSGDGGKVIVWADDRTAFSGAIEAKGGAEGGNGGFVEVSGKQFLDFKGTVNTTAAKGKTGTLLLDPTNLTIGNVNTSSWITKPNSTFADFTTNTDPDPAHDFSFLHVDVLQAALASNDITVQSACAASPTCEGNITVKDAITWSSGKGLTLDATGNIFINASINSTGAAGTKGGNFNALAGKDIDVYANITTTGGAAANGGAGTAGGNVNLQARDGAVNLAGNAVINTSGSAAAVTGSGAAAGGAAGSITASATKGIALSGDLLATGGVGRNDGADGVGGTVNLTTTTGNVSQGAGSEIVGNELVVSAAAGNVALTAGNNAVNRLAGVASAGNFSYRNIDTAGLTITNIGGVNGVSAGGTGNVSLTARNLQINSNVATQTGSITLTANGPEAGDISNFSGVVLAANQSVTTQGGTITIDGRGGNADAGDQAGVKLLAGSSVSAGGNGGVSVTGSGGNNVGNNNAGVVVDGATVQTTGTGTVSVTGTGGAGDGNQNHGVVVDGGVITATGSGAVEVTGTSGTGTGRDNYGVLVAGKGAANTGMITSAAGAITVVAEGGSGEENHALVFQNKGQIGDTTGNRDVTIQTTVGSGADSVAYSSDADGGYIGTGTGSLTLIGDTLSTDAPVAVRSTGDLTVQSLGHTFSNPFKLSAFTRDFSFNDGGTGFDSIGNLTIGKTGNIAAIDIDQALSLANRTVTLIGGATTLSESVAAGSLIVTSSGNVNLNKTITAATVNAQTSNGNVTLADKITAGTAVSLRTSQGNVNVGGEIAATGATVTLSATGNASGGGTVGVNKAITANSLNITATNTASTATTVDGKANLNDVITANTLNITATNDVTQSSGGLSVASSATLNSAKGDITLNSSSNQIANLNATANTTDGDITVNNGSSELALSGNLTAKSVHLKAKSLNQTSGVITADGLEVVTTAGDATLDGANKVGTIAASVTGGDFTFRNSGNSTAAINVGTVVSTFNPGSMVGITATGAVKFNAVYDMDIAEAIKASSVSIDAGSRNIDLGGVNGTDSRLSLTAAEINRISGLSNARTSLNLKTTGKVTNSADVRAAGLSTITIDANAGIDKVGSGVLGFSGIENGSLTLKASGTDAGMGIGSTNALVTVGASSLTLTSARDIRVVARKNDDSAANLDKLHITSASAGANDSALSVASTATLSLTGTGVLPSWYQSATPTVKGTYNISLTNTDALDFKFIGNAPINVNGTSNIGSANFALQTTYGINVGADIVGTTGAISLTAGGGSGNYKGISLNGRSITTSDGSITLNARGGTGLNTSNVSNVSDQFGVWIAGGGSVRATGTGTISITGQGGSANSGNGGNNDGVVITDNGFVQSDTGRIVVAGTGGSGSGSASATSDGIVLADGAITSNGNVTLSGKSGSGITGTASRAITQSGSGVITASGLEVIANTEGEAVLTNNNKVATLAAHVTTGLYFDNGGVNDLSVGIVNESKGITGNGTVGLYDINVLTLNETVTGSDVAIASDALVIANGKRLTATNVWLTSEANRSGSTGYEAWGARNIDIGTVSTGSTLRVTTPLLDQIDATSMTLATSGATTITSDTDFKHVSEALTLRSTGAITNNGAYSLILSDAKNDGFLTLNGSVVGSDSQAILAKGANKISVSSGNLINVRALTLGASNLTDTSPDLIQLKSVSINSTSNAANLTYKVQGKGLDYALTGDASSYSLVANAITNPVDFSFTGNRAVTITGNSDLKGGDFSVSAGGNLTVDRSVTSKAANFRAAGNVTFTDSASVAASGPISIRSDIDNGVLTTGTGAITSDGNDGNDGNISIWADNVALGSGGLNAQSGTGTVSIDTRADVTSNRGILLGGEDAARLSLSQAELNTIRAAKLVIGRNNQTYATSGGIAVAGVDLAQANGGAGIAALELKNYSGSVTQTGALTVNKLDVSLATGAVTLNNAANNIRQASIGSGSTVSLANTGALTFSANANGDVTVNNSDSLNIAGINSNGGAIAVTSFGDLSVSSAVTATETANGANQNGAAINLQSTNGSLIINAGITSNGFSSSDNSPTNGGNITLRGQDVTIGNLNPVSITASGTGGGNSTSSGGAAGSVTIASTLAGGDIVLKDTTITVKAGNGGFSGGGGAGGTAGSVTLTAAAGGDISLTGGSIDLNGAHGGGTASNGANAGRFELNTTGSGTVALTNTPINLNGGNGAGTGMGGNAGSFSASASTVALTGTDVSLNGGNGGGTNTGGNGGYGGSVALYAAVNGEVRLSASNFYLNGGNGAGSNGNGGAAGNLSIPAYASAKTILNGGSISLVGGSAGANGSRGAGSSLTFSNQVVLDSANFDINAGGRNVRFVEAVDGDVNAGSLTIHSSRTSGGTTTYGTLTFDKDIGATTAIGNLTAYSVQDVTAGTVNSSGNVNLNINGDATLGAVTATGSLSVANTGTTAHQIQLGAVTAGSVSVTNTKGTTTLNGNVTANNLGGGISVTSKTLQASNRIYETLNGGSISLATTDAMTLGNTSAFKSTGDINLTATDGITINGGSLTTEGRAINFHSKTVLTQDVTIDTTINNASAGGNVSFMSTLDSDGANSARALTINAGTNGNVKFDGAVGSTAALGAMNIASAKDVTASSTVNAASFIQQAGNGTTAFNGTTALTGNFAFTGKALNLNALTAQAVSIANSGQLTTSGAIAAANGFTQSDTGTVQLGGDITTVGKDILINGVTTINGGVTLSTGATGDGDIRFAKAVDNVSANSGSLTLTAGNGEIVFGGNLGETTALGDLTINSTKNVTLPVSVTARSLTTDADGGTTLKNGAVITTQNGQTYNDAVTLDDTVTNAATVTAVSTNGGQIKFASTVDGARALAVNTTGATIFAGQVGGTTALTSLTTNAGGTVTFSGGGVTTTGSQTYGDNVVLGADASFNSTNGANITFAGKVDGPHAMTVTTKGATAFNGAVGLTNALSSVTVDHVEGKLLINGGWIRTTGNQTYRSANMILADGLTTLQSTSNGTIALMGKVDADVCTTASLDILTQGATILGGAIGSYRPLWNLRTDGQPGGNNTVAFQQGTVITLNNQTYGELAVLDTNTSLKSLGQGNIKFDGPVHAAQNGAQSLTVDTSGDIIFNGKVGETGTQLASLNTGASVDGTVRLNGGGVNTTGAQQYTKKVALGNATTLESSNNGNVTFAGTLDGGALTVSTGGTTRFDGAIGGTTPLASLTTGTSGNVVFNSGVIRTTGAQQYNNAVTLVRNTVMSSSGAGDVTFARTLDGAYSLAIDTSGVTQFDGAVGGNTALASLVTDVGGTVKVNGGLVRTIGEQTFNENVEVGADTVFTASGPINFGSELDGPHDVTVRTPGVTTFAGAIGSNAPLKNLNGGTGAGSINLMGPSITLTGSLIFEELVRVYGPTKVDVGVDALFYGDARVGKSLLDVTAGGRIQYGRPVDNIKNYLPTLFAVANQSAQPMVKPADVQQPVSVALLDNTSSRQLGVGNLQFVNLTATAPTQSGTTGTQSVSESAVDQAVGQIAGDESARSLTYIVSVQGGVRVGDEMTEEAR